MSIADFFEGKTGLEVRIRHTSDNEYHNGTYLGADDYYDNTYMFAWRDNGSIKAVYAILTEIDKVDLSPDIPRIVFHATYCGISILEPGDTFSPFSYEHIDTALKANDQ